MRAPTVNKDQLAQLREWAEANHPALVEAGNDTGIADAISAVTEQLVTPPTVERSTLVAGLIDMLILLAVKDADSRGKWDRILSILTSVESLPAATAERVLDLAQADGLIDADGIKAVLQRPGATAEILWGAGTVVTAHHVAAAFGRE